MLTAAEERATREDISIQSYVLLDIELANNMLLSKADIGEK